MIYAIECVGTQYIKFGYTNELTVVGRLRDLQIGCPLQLRLIASCSGGKEVETKIHWLLRQSAHRGEWFSKGPAVDAVLAMMRRDAWRQPRPVTSPSSHRRFGKALDYSKQCVNELVSLEPKVIEQPALAATASSRSARVGRDPTLGFDLAAWRADRVRPQQYDDEAAQHRSITHRSSVDCSGLPLIINELREPS